MDEQQILNEQYGAACELRRPCVMFKPRLFIDGDKWCALYGDNLQDGVAGFGDSPENAMWDFDRAWGTKLTATPAQKKESATERAIRLGVNVKPHGEPTEHDLAQPYAEDMEPGNGE